MDSFSLLIDIIITQASYVYSTLFVSFVYHDVTLGQNDVNIFYFEYIQIRLIYAL